MLRLYNQNCVEYLENCDEHYDAIFLDPPDNIGLAYKGYYDLRPDYYEFISEVLYWSCRRSSVVWLSFNANLLRLMVQACRGQRYSKQKLFIWRYKFGQYNPHDCGSGFRPIMRLSAVDWKPNVDQIRVKSERQRLGDSRAIGPRVPDDVWEFPRITGNHSERQSWHPTQHPEALVERMFLMSIRKHSGSRKFLDCFAGSGTSIRVCKRHGWGLDCCEISEYYCSELAAKHNLAIEEG